MELRVAQGGIQPVQKKCFSSIHFGLEISSFCVQSQSLISAFSQILTNTMDLVSSRVRAQVLTRTLWQIPGNSLDLGFLSGCQGRRRAGDLGSCGGSLRGGVLREGGLLERGSTPCLPRRDRSRGRESRLSRLSSRLSPRLKGDFVLDLLLLGGLRRLERVRDRLSRPFKASSRLLLIVSTIWRNSATSSSRRPEAATLAEADGLKQQHLLKLGSM